MSLSQTQRASHFDSQVNGQVNCQVNGMANGLFNDRVDSLVEDIRTSTYTLESSARDYIIILSPHGLLVNSSHG